MPKLIRVKEINEETIIVAYGIQYFCIHTFGRRNSKHIIRKAAAEIGDRRYMKLGQLLAITKKHDLVITSKGKR